MARLALAVLAALVLATPGAAAPQKARISASLLTSPRGLVAERPWNALVAVRDGARPATAKWVTVTISGELGRRSFRAAATRRPGRFRARVTFPGGGAWTLGVRAGARTARLVAVEVRGAGPRIAAPFGLVAAVEHGDLIVVDREGGGIYELNLRTREDEARRRRTGQPGIPHLRARRLPVRLRRAARLALRARRRPDPVRGQRDARALRRRRPGDERAARRARGLRLRRRRTAVHLRVRQRRPARDPGRADRHARWDRARGLLR